MKLSSLNNLFLLAVRVSLYHKPILLFSVVVFFLVLAKLEVLEVGLRSCHPTAHISSSCVSLRLDDNDGGGLIRFVQWKFLMLL